MSKIIPMKPQVTISNLQNMGIKFPTWEMKSGKRSLAHMMKDRGTTVCGQKLRDKKSIQYIQPNQGEYCTRCQEIIKPYYELWEKNNAKFLETV